MRIGYARVSDKKQNVSRQIKELTEAGCEKIFIDKKTGRNFDREDWNNLLSYARERDEIVVTEIDRLGRDNLEITKAIDTLRMRGITVEVRNFPSTKEIKDYNLKLLVNGLMIEIYKYLAEQELTNRKITQQKGIDIAKSQGKYKGRPLAYSPDSKNLQKKAIYFQIVERLKMNHSINSISTELAVNRRTISKIKSKLEDDLNNEKK